MKIDNKTLKAKYDEMHEQGPVAWFSDGEEERKTIIDVGTPWKGVVLEIGCGEGDLCRMIKDTGASEVHGVDYSKVAIHKAFVKHAGRGLIFVDCGFRDIKGRYDRVVMQGVLEHLDNPWDDLTWILENLLKPGGDIITSSPCFYNPRGVAWMALNMLGAVMSKTDIHHLHQFQFESWAADHDCQLMVCDCDNSWGNGHAMIEDLKVRIPLALKDGNIAVAQEKIDEFILYLTWYAFFTEGGEGATKVYHIIPLN